MRFYTEATAGIAGLCTVVVSALLTTISTTAIDTIIHGTVAGNVTNLAT